jgi:RNA polymerase sigma factor (sigma-70 family)
MAAIEKSVRAASALDDLYRRHVGDVYRYTYAVLGNHADAEDVTQTTFVNALRALERGEEPQNPSNWLLVIAHNIVRQRWRQAATRPTEVELVHDVTDLSGEDDVELEGLVRALQRIPPAQREALVMRELEGRSYREISELLGLTTSALETLLFRARRSLAEELENVVTCQSAELAMSQRIDHRLSRKESRRLDEHLAECVTCARLAQTQARQRKAFKGLAVLPLPIGLALFKDVPTAAAAGLPTIGGAATSSGSSTGVGTATTATGGVAGAGSATTGGVAVGGSLIGGAVAKVAAVIVAGVLVTGAAYQGTKLVLGTSGNGEPAAAKQQSDVKGAFASRDAKSAANGVELAASSPSATAPATTSVVDTGRSGGLAVESSDGAHSTGTEPVAGGQEPGTAPAGGQDGPGTTPSEPTTPSSPGDDGPAGNEPQAPGTTPQTPPPGDAPPSGPEQSSAAPPTTSTSSPVTSGGPKSTRPKKPKRQSTPVGQKGKKDLPSQAQGNPPTASDEPKERNPNAPAKPDDGPVANGGGPQQTSGSDSTPPVSSPTTTPATEPGAPATGGGSTTTAPTDAGNAGGGKGGGNDKK